MATPTSKADQVRKAAEADLFTFARLVNPSYVYGSVHRECFRWLQQDDLNQLLLLPRGHLKSHMVAVWCAWWITRHPETTILYVSATEDLATQQLYAIKAILESDIHRRYWPDMIHPEEAKREEWNFKNIKVDHPARKAASVRDRTVAARSVGGNTTGLHCDVLVFDDLVVPDNAYTQEGRDGVQRAYSQFSSVASPGARTKVVGTRYHGKDVYHTMMTAEIDQFDPEGNIVGSTKQYEVLEKQVETDGDFLWPRAQNVKSGKWFGFDNVTLARIRSTYFSAGERAQYYAQYYNNPEAPDDERVTSEKFQYYERKHLTSVEGVWHFKGKPLAVFAAGDIAYTDGTSSDYTALAVIGVDQDGYIYILELDQFKTTKYDRIYQSVERMFDKWHFRKMRIETNAGANLVVEYIKDSLRKNGKALTIEGKKSEGEKTQRAEKILLPRYDNRTIWHYEGGWITTYEEQVTLQRPSHDDLRDAVSAAIEISKPAIKRHSTHESRGNLISFNSRFGGRIGR
jgi:predicted phage terminase large subunit-like protein